MSERAAAASRAAARDWPTILAGGLAITGLSVTVASLLIWGSEGFDRLPASFAQTTLAIIPGQLTAIGYVLVGALLGARMPRNPVGWLLLGAGLVMSLILPITLLVDAAHEAFRPAPGSTLALAWWMSSMGTPATVGLIAMAGLLFPDGRLISPSWRPIAWLTIGSTIALGLTAGFDPDGLLWFPTLPNALAAPSQVAPLLSIFELVAIVMLITAMAGLMASFVLRYRRGDAVMRAQLRWIVYAVVIQVVGTLPFILARYVITVSDAVGELSVALAEISSLALPVAAAMAVTRRHLFGIDRLINRTLVYVSLIGVLGGLYAAVVWLFQRLFVSVTGQVSEAPLFFAVFLIAAAFTPVRKSLDGMVDRWARAPATANGDGNEDGATPPGDLVVGDASSAISPPAPAAVLAPAPAAVLAPADLADPEVLRVAAAVLAWRRFEARFSDPGSGAPAAAAALDAASVADGAGEPLAIGADGRVPCPMLGLEQSVTVCLGCPHLRALQTAPPVVRCGFASAAATGA
jgi:hypothetical protein